MSLSAIVKLGTIRAARKPRRPEQIVVGPLRPIAERVTLTLPVPPSVNNLFANRASGGRFKSREYADWLVEAGWRIQAQKPARIIGAYEMDLTIARPSHRRKVDISNRIKAIEDVLVSHCVIEDDSLCERLVMEWAPAGEGVLVTISKAAPRA
jgi:Holliday junction resolvase RusA-like endonuclease